VVCVEHVKGRAEAGLDGSPGRLSRVRGLVTCIALGKILIEFYPQFALCARARGRARVDGREMWPVLRPSLDGAILNGDASVPHALLDWKCFPRGNPSWPAMSRSPD